MLWHFDELSEFARSGYGGFNATSDRVQTPELSPWGPHAQALPYANPGGEGLRERPVSFGVGERRPFLRQDGESARARPAAGAVTSPPAASRRRHSHRGGDPPDRPQASLVPLVSVPRTPRLGEMCDLAGRRPTAPVGQHGGRMFAQRPGAVGTPK